MKGYEYRKLWEKGQSDFEKIDHNKILTKKISESLDHIVHFLEMPREEIMAYQLKRLGEIVDYAYQNIPLYKKKYDAIGYKVGDVKTFEDFERIPLLYKEELIEGFPEQIVKSVEDFKYSTRSSGSSAKFVTIALNLDAIYTDTLQGFRQFIRQSQFEYTKKDRV